MRITIISKGTPYAFKDPDDIIIESDEAVSFDASADGLLRVYAYKKEEAIKAQP